jgi:hypothetical protein
VKKALLLLTYVFLAASTPLPAAVVKLPVSSTITADNTYTADTQRGGSYCVNVKGTFGGATVSLQYLNPTTNTWDEAKSFTAATLWYVHIANNNQARFVVSGSTGTTNLSIEIFSCAPLSSKTGGSYSSDISDFLTAADYPGARSKLGLGTMATQSASSVAITGGSASGLSSLSANAPLWSYKVTGTNYERGTFGYSANNLVIGTEAGGTGLLRPMMLGASGVTIQPLGLGTTTGQTTYDATTGAVNISSTVANGTGPTSGALVVGGGVGIGQGLYVNTFVITGAASVYGFNGRGGLRATSDGNFIFQNQASTVSGNLVLGTVSFTGLTDSGKTISTTAGTSATINSATGRFRVSAGSGTFTLNNSQVVSTTIATLTQASADSTAALKYAIAGAGTLTCTFAPPTTDTDFNFRLSN